MPRIASILTVVLLLASPLTSYCSQAHPSLTPTEQRVCYFQYKLMPRLIFSGDGYFFQSLLRGETDRLHHAAAELVSPAFADYLKVYTIAPDKAVLIVFARPRLSPMSYCAIIARTADSFAYYTLEKASPTKEAPNVRSIFASINARRQHINHGTREYTSPRSFAKEFLTDPPAFAAAE